MANLEKLGASAQGGVQGFQGGAQLGMMKKLQDRQKVVQTFQTLSSILSLPPNFRKPMLKEFGDKLKVSPALIQGLSTATDEQAEAIKQMFVGIAKGNKMTMNDVQSFMQDPNKALQFLNAVNKYTTGVQAKKIVGELPSGPNPKVLREAGQKFQGLGNLDQAKLMFERATAAEKRAAPTAKEKFGFEPTKEYKNFILSGGKKDDSEGFAEYLTEKKTDAGSMKIAWVNFIAETKGIDKSAAIDIANKRDLGSFLQTAMVADIKNMFVTDPVERAKQMKEKLDANLKLFRDIQGLSQKPKIDAMEILNQTRRGGGVPAGSQTGEVTGIRPSFMGGSKELDEFFGE